MEDDQKRYEAAMHAMQSGVAYEMGQNGEELALGRELTRIVKHLRVGNNARAADARGLADLLIAKGIFTKEEYVASVTRAMEDERDIYQAKMPPNVRLV